MRGKDRDRGTEERKEEEREQQRKKGKRRKREREEMDKESQLRVREMLSERQKEMEGWPAWSETPRDKSTQGENQKEWEIGRRERQEKAKSVCGGDMKAGKMTGNIRKVLQRSGRGERDRPSSHPVDVSNPSQGGI